MVGRTPMTRIARTARYVTGQLTLEEVHVGSAQLDQAGHVGDRHSPILVAKCCGRPVCRAGRGTSAKRDGQRDLIP
jgi:hypothetical protein